MNAYMKKLREAALQRLLEKVDVVNGPRNRTKFIKRCVLQFGPVMLQSDLREKLKRFQKMEQALRGNGGQKRP